MTRRITTVAIFGLLTASFASAESFKALSPSDFEVAADERRSIPGLSAIADRRIFTAAAFLLSMGFDQEADPATMHPVRRKVSAFLVKARAENPEKFAAWQQLYDKNPNPPFVFLDFALTLSSDYPFRCVRENSEMTYSEAAESLRQLVDIWNDFWVTARLSDAWAEAKPEYLAELQQYDLPAAQQALDQTWAYVRLPRHDTFTVVLIPNLLGRRSNAIGATYGTAYWIVESPGAISRKLNVHEYLHSIVNPIARRNIDRSDLKLQAYFNAGRSGSFAKSYQDITIFTYECLVRAIDARIALRTAREIEKPRIVHRIIDDANDNGLNLTRPFFELLPQFEQSTKSLDQFMPELLERVPPWRPSDQK